MNSVALLSALPRSLEDIDAGANDRTKDYVRAQVLIKQNTPVSAWKTLRPYLKDSADALFDWCRDVGTPVIERAGLPEFRDALASYETVILLAHWKGPGVHPKDLPDTVEEITEVGLALGVGEVLSAGMSARAARHAVQSALNERIETWVDWLDLSNLGQHDVIIGDYYGRCLARENMNAMIAGRLNCVFVPGVRLELSDGLWSAQEIASCFSEGWNGVCDFVCCRSLYLSDVVKASTRAGLIRADARYLQPERVIEVVGKILKATASGCPYHKAAYNIEDDLK